APVEPMYMPGRLRTASRPSRTVMSWASYERFGLSAEGLSLANGPPMTLQRPGAAPGGARRGVEGFMCTRIAQGAPRTGAARMENVLQIPEKMGRHEGPRAAVTQRSRLTSPTAIA